MLLYLLLALAQKGQSQKQRQKGLRKGRGRDRARNRDRVKVCMEESKGVYGGEERDICRRGKGCMEERRGEGVPAKRTFVTGLFLQCSPIFNGGWWLVVGG